MPTFWNLLDWPEITAAGLDSLAMLGGALCFILLLGLPLGIVLHLFARRQLLADVDRVQVLLLVGPVAVAVLEVDAARQLPAARGLDGRAFDGDGHVTHPLLRLDPQAAAVNGDLAVERLALGEHKPVDARLRCALVDAGDDGRCGRRGAA